MTEASPLAVYVHWPYCARICPYCDFNVVRDRGRGEEQAALLDAILADLRAQAAMTGPHSLTSIFFGGGTPSLMRPAWIAAVVAQALALWPADDPLEISLEANPADASRFGDIASAGVNRLSLGVQAFDDEALAFLGRDHSADQATVALEAALEVTSRVSADLIYALPGQTERAWAGELRRAVAMGVEHVSPYQLTIEAGTAFDRAVRRGAFTPAEPDLAADLYETTQEILEQAGFEAYEVSNHARGEAARSRHNLSYWRGEAYVGVGPGAHGRLDIEGRRTATVAARRIGDYVERVRACGVGWDTREALTAVEAAEERLVMGLRTVEGVAFADLAGIGLDERHPALASHRGAGLLHTRGGRLFATAAGRLVLDRLTLELITSASRGADGAQVAARAQTV